MQVDAGISGPRHAENMVTTGNPGLTKVLGTQRHKIPEADMGWITEYPAIDYIDMILQVISFYKRDSANRCRGNCRA
ncbi:MAG: hypothetical protein A3J97_04960 [Spirochaetes bacterium RIFOXYC1_FULL_54_7]|nr:MAG: hypothetical protein A3J97_04960 [Spirochaetes bacterium RIFOXYC1_FULL_54_7]